jgi:chromosome segregation ATPase
MGIILWQMTSRLPPEIREQVLILWLKAYSRDDIAKIVGVGSGTVSGIVNDYNRRNPGFELLREFVVAIRKEGTNVRHFASAIRLQRLLESHSLTAEQIESFIANAATQCLKRKEDLNKFIGDVNKTADLSNRAEVPLEELPVHIQEKERKLQSLTRDVYLLKEEEREAARKCNAVQTQLEESRKHLVQVQEKQASWNMLEMVTCERDNLDGALASCVKEMSWYKPACRYLVYALYEANKKLSKMTSAAQQIPRNQLNKNYRR